MQPITHFFLALILFSSAMALSTPERFMPKPQYDIVVKDFTLARDRNTDIVHFSFLTQDPSDPEFDGVICREVVAANDAAPGGIPNIGRSMCEKSVVETDFTRHVTGQPNKVGTIDQTDHFFRLQVYTAESMCLKDFPSNDLAIDYMVKDGGQWGHFANKTFTMACYLSPEQAQKDSHIAKEGKQQSAAAATLPGHVAWIVAAAFFSYSLS